MKDTDKNIDYVAKHFREGRFSVDNGWKRLGIEQQPRRRFRLGAAAAIAAVVVITATAAFVYNSYNKQPPTDVETTAPTVDRPEMAVKVIDFEDTPLPTVVSHINEVYGVEVGNLPDSAGEYHLSLHYEGNALDLITTINELLDVNLTVNSK
jgi:hypothetical protein